MDYEYPNQVVHCLECDTIYPEQQPIVEACPDCGNDNMGLTVYLQGETNENKKEKPIHSGYKDEVLCRI